MRSIRERELRRNGSRAVAGCDEAGRGAWAGPLVAAAVILPPYAALPGLNDSKRVSALQRERLYVKISLCAQSWAVGIISPAEIDAYGITWANTRAMEIALSRLRVAPDYVLVDALPLRLPVPSDSIIRGDSQERVIAAASIIAKVTRDALVSSFARHYPHYGFPDHKGYGTRAHESAIEKFGITAHHRTSFAGLDRLL